MCSSLLENSQYSLNPDKTENMLVHGDNLPVLKNLLNTCATRFKCIYIDPPYNTGKIKSNDDNGTGYIDSLSHANWISMMKERLVLLKELLSSEGTIFIQIDDNEFARLYLLVADLFGESNVKTICIKMAEPTGVKMRAVLQNKGIPRLKEYLVLAQKTGIKNLDIERVPKKKWDYEYRYIVSGLNREEISELKSILNDETVVSADMIKRANELAERIRVDDTLSTLFSAYSNLNERDKTKIKFENAWRIVRDVSVTVKAKKMADEQKGNSLEGCFVMVTPQSKKYLIQRNYDSSLQHPRIRLLFADDYLTYHPGDFWEDIKTTGLDKEGGFPFRLGKKPEALIKRVIGMSTSPGDWVLDAFAGSGTTGAVAQKMNRKWVLIEKENHIHSHIIPRMKRVISGEDKSGVTKVCGFTGGGGFRFYEFHR